MAFVEWSMQGVEVSHCNCNIGCPCQFNALPTHGNCRAYMFFQIDKGHYGKVKLDGVRWGGLFTWPGPIHMGNGTAMVVVDKAASAEQKSAIEAVASGKDTDPGSLITQVFSTTLIKGHPTVFKPLALELDEKAGTASIKVAGLIDASAEPIKNIVTGAVSRARVTLPEGFEYTDAEYVSGSGKTTGPIKLDFKSTHAHIARIHWSQNGVVR